MANEYVAAATLKATLDLTNETFADADIAAALTAASRAIDRICGQRFYTTTNDETRYFAATNNERLLVRDLLSVTSMATAPNGDATYSDTWTANADFTYEPANAALDGEPYRWIVRHPLGSFYFPVGYPRAIRIVGKFGWTTAPAEVIDATTMLASRLLRRKREAPFGVVSVGIDVGAIARISSFDPDVAMLLQPFVDAPFA